MYYSRMRNLIVTSLIFFLSLLFSSTDSAAQIRLAWNPNTESDLAGYLVHYGTASRTYGAPINVGNATSYTLTGLTPDIRYYFAVTAYDTAYNESGYSNEVHGTINPIEEANCPCRSDVDNYCLYGPSTPGCSMTDPGGYCDPNGDGNFSDADWSRGYREFGQYCR